MRIARRGMRVRLKGLRIIFGLNDYTVSLESKYARCSLAEALSHRVKAS